MSVQKVLVEVPFVHHTASVMESRGLDGLERYAGNKHPPGWHCAYALENPQLG